MDRSRTCIVAGPRAIPCGTGVPRIDNKGAHEASLPVACPYCFRGSGLGRKVRAQLRHGPRILPGSKSPPDSPVQAGA